MRTLARGQEAVDGRPDTHAEEHAEVAAIAVGVRVWYVTSFSQCGRWNVADSAEMAANMPITWAMMAGQKTPPLRQYSEVRPVFCSSLGT